VIGDRCFGLARTRLSCRYLSFNLIAANRFLPEVLRDERLKPMLENMAKAYTGPDYGAARKVSVVIMTVVVVVVWLVLICAPMRLHRGQCPLSHHCFARLQSVDRVTADDVDPLAQSAFPLCMQVMHQSLRDKHKLKHLGRLQYGLFLKGVGAWRRREATSMPCRAGRAIACELRC